MPAALPGLHGQLFDRVGPDLAGLSGVQQPRDYKGLRCLTGPNGPFEAKSNSRGLSNREGHNKFVSDVVQSDDGRYRLGIHDEGPGFESRRFAASVMALERPPPDDPEMRSPAVVGDGRANRKNQYEPTNYTPRAVRPQEFSTSWGAA